jgi:hypothetical protein
MAELVVLVVKFGVILRQAELERCQPQKCKLHINRDYLFLTENQSDNLTWLHLSGGFSVVLDRLRLGVESQDAT